MAYFYVRKTFTTLATANENTTDIRVGDYFLVSSDNSNSGIYKRDQNTPSVISTKITSQPGVAPTKTVTSYAVTLNSNIVVGTSTAHGFLVGDKIFINGATGTEQVKLNGEWTITQKTDDTFTFSVSSNFDSTGSLSTNLGVLRYGFDRVLSLLDNSEYINTGGTPPYLRFSLLSLSSAVLIAVQQYKTGATQPIPLGLSTFPVSIDELKILDYSSDGTAAGHLSAYYSALATYYSNPTITNADLVNAKAANVQNYILTETDYNKMSSAIMNIQLYLAQYMEDEFTSVTSVLNSQLGSAAEYINDVNALMVKISDTDPAVKGYGGRYYIWFDTNVTV